MIKEFKNRKKAKVNRIDRGLIVNTKLGIKLTEHEVNDILKICYKYKMTPELVLHTAFIDYPHMNYNEAIRELIMDSGIIADNAADRNYYNSIKIESLWD